MNKKEAFKMDTAFYVEFDDVSGVWCVFGDNSGVAYSTWNSFEEAEEASNMVGLI